MKSKKAVLLIALMLASWSYTSAQNSSFLKINAPGEDSCLFKQITSEGQKLSGPEVIKTKNKIKWYTGSIFDVSPDGENITYICDGNVFVKSLTTDTTSERRTLNIISSNPRFSPDGLSICFSGTLMGQKSSDICIIDTYNGFAVKHITDRLSGYDSAPVFSSGGEEIIFTRGLPVQEVKGSSTIITWNYSIWSTLLAVPGATQYIEGSAPDFLYDNKILYTKTNPVTYQGEIWMYDLSTGNDSLILFDAKRGFSTPRISPDGKKVLCTGMTNDKKGKASNLDIYVFNIDGTNLQQVTFHPGTDASPCWSPNGNNIYFMSQRGNKKGEFNIWRVNLSQDQISN